jgi:hemolysin type calcium-binding protein
MRTAWGALIAIAWMAAPAQAATVRAEVLPGSFPVAYSLHFDAATGETNTVTITPVEDGWTVTDATAPLTAGDRCTRVDEHTAHCPAAREVRVRGGDGDDSLTLAEVEPIAHLDGGPGDDTLTGGNGPDVLDGGGGTDTLRGGGGSDLLDDADGVAPDADRYDGGPGFDEVDYGDRRTAIRVDLRHASGQGTVAENDAFASIERIAGGRGDDRLVGMARRNELDGGGGHDVLIGGRGPDEIEGGSGRDRVRGGRGDDVIYGGTGRDRLSGGAGDDSLGSHDGIAERMRCGAGRDTITDYVPNEGVFRDEPEYDRFGPDPSDSLDADCEHASIDEDSGERTVPVQPVARTASSLLFLNPCVFHCERGTLRLRVDDRSIALMRFANRSKERRVALPLAVLPARGEVFVRWRVHGGGVYFEGATFTTAAAGWRAWRGRARTAATTCRPSALCRTRRPTRRGS